MALQGRGVRDGMLCGMAGSLATRVDVSESYLRRARRAFLVQAKHPVMKRLEIPKALTQRQIETFQLLQWRGAKVARANGRSFSGFRSIRPNRNPNVMNYAISVCH